MELLGGLGGTVDMLVRYVIPFLIVLTILVFVHEWGHYWVARKCGVKIEAFSIGFGQELFGWRDKHGTRWKISLIPLGGYVKMYGDADPASRPQREVAADAAEEEGASGHFADTHYAPAPMTPEQRAQSFHHKPLWQRTAIVAAGPAANFIFAVIVLALVFMTVGQPYTVAEVGFVEEGTIADQAGIEPGDIVTAVDGRRISRFEQVDQSIRLNQGSPVTLQLSRDGEDFEVTVTPEVVEFTNRLGTHEIGSIGIYPIDKPVVGSVQPGSAADNAGFEDGDTFVAIDGQSIQRFQQIQEIVANSPDTLLRVTVLRDGEETVLEVIPRPVEVTNDAGETIEIGQLGITRGIVTLKRHDPATATGLAVIETYDLTVSTLRTVGQILSGSRDADQIGGPLRIAQMSGETAQSGWLSLITFMVLLSINLGLINLFPIPMLDGGHLLFYAIEAVRGRPLGPRAQEYGFRFGLALVLSLAGFALWNDLVHLNVVDQVSSLFS